ncbi:MAG: homoserine dehydrogenase [Candidatus Omnitrophica bacterium]|nr:homoserine dehydrogenase [Candidatus Omnitrophota bacterium]
MEKKKLRIGVIGCGTVGGSVIRSLKLNRQALKKKTGIDISVVKAFDKDKNRQKEFPSIFTSSAEDIVNAPEIDIVVELIGGVDYAHGIVTRALKNGKSVVTANKALIAEKVKEIFGLAEEKNLYMGFEASVAGAIPAIKTIRESFIGNNISRILAILNGTTNYILTRMSLDRLDFSEALSTAQEMGYAEANSTLDIKGIDTAHKLSILSGLAFNKFVHWKQIPVEGIEKVEPIDIGFTAEFGYRVKLLAVAQKKDNTLDLRVHPALLPMKHLLSMVEGVYNAVYIEGDMAGKSLFYGEGAGGGAAASAVVADIVDICKEIAQKNLPCSTLLYEDEKLTTVSMEDIYTRYYLRFTALDKPGVLAGISGILGKNGISIASVIQKEESPEKAVPVLILTHRAKEKSMRDAISEIDKLAFIKKPTVLLRVEE